MLFQHLQLVVCRGEKPLDKLPPGWLLRLPGLHWYRGAKVVPFRQEIRAELLPGGGSVLTDDLPAVLEVETVLLQAGLLPQSLQLVPVGGQQSLKWVANNEEPSQAKLRIMK